AVHHLDLREYRWVVFTSANAVDAFLDLLLERGEDVRLLGGANLCAIGTATARALLARGLRADLVPAEADAEGVVDALRRQPHDLAVTGARVLLPRAERARDVLPEGLREVGATVDELTLYLSAPPADPPAGAFDLVRSGA